MSGEEDRTKQMMDSDINFKINIKRGKDMKEYQKRRKERVELRRQSMAVDQHISHQKLVEYYGQIVHDLIKSGSEGMSHSELTTEDMNKIKNKIKTSLSQIIEHSK